MPRLLAGGRFCCCEDRVIRGLFENFPDAVWSELKLWAQAQAHAPQPATIADCVRAVERIAKKLTGVADALRPEVVAFYANETSDMIARFKATVVSDGIIEPGGVAS